jgi:glycosyltransferase involved in cell wall biosynthesis
MQRTRQDMSRVLSILVPVYNERSTVLTVLDRLENLRLPVAAEIIVVDDGSTDGTRALLAGLDGRSSRYPLRVFFHPENRGKGAAVRTAMDQARGGILVIQDADLELDPQDIIGLLEPILRDEAQVCFGSRFLRPDRALYRLPTYWANRILNLLSNVINGIWITDFNTCYKMFPSRIKDRLNLTSRGFAMEAEITAKLARMGLKIHERPVYYQPRPRREGKKIRARDLFAYLGAMLRFRFAPLTSRDETSGAMLLSPVAATSPPLQGDWQVVEELREAWDALWEPARQPASTTNSTSHSSADLAREKIEPVN